MPSPAYAFDAATADDHFQGATAAQPSGLQLVSSEEDEEKPSVDTWHLLFAMVGVVVLLLMGSAVWWWQRGSDVHFKISPADATVTLDGAPLAVVNGEVTVPALKRGVHMVAVAPPQGGLLRQSVDVSFLESSQSVVVKIPVSGRAVASQGRR